MRDLEYYDRRVMRIGPRCPSVQGWRRGPPEYYYQNCAAAGLLPEPGVARLLERLAASSAPALDLSRRSVGDALAAALADPIAVADPTSVDVSECRLSTTGIAALCDALAKRSSRLVTLDLGHNSCKTRAASDALERLVAGGAEARDTLRSLRLANCCLRSDAAFRVGGPARKRTAVSFFGTSSNP